MKWKGKAKAVKEMVSKRRKMGDEETWESDDEDALEMEKEERRVFEGLC